MSIGQELEELKSQIKLISQHQDKILQELQNLYSKINKIEATLEMVTKMVSKPAKPKSIEIIRDNRWK